jgi:hypothetical protein
MQDQIQTGEKSIWRWLPALFLATAGLLVFVRNGIGPWSWPSLDMAPYFVNLQYPGFINHDFFTSCFGKDNGRAIFGAMTGWPILLGLGWHKTLYGWMLLNSALMPASFYLGITSAIQNPTRRLKVVVFIAVALAIRMPDRVNYLTVAWWPGWGNNFHPSAFCISMIGFAVTLLSSRREGLKIAGCFLAFLAALIHPAYAIGGALFYSALFLTRENRIRLIALFLGSVLAGLVFMKLFLGSGALSANEYSRYYAWLHPEHYIPSRFVALGPFPWYWPAAFLLIGFFVAATVLGLKKRFKWALLPASFLAIYGLSLGTQYLFVERNPVFTLLLLISPSRFLAYGYWMLVVTTGLLCSLVPVRPNRGPNFAFGSKTAKLTGIALSVLLLAGTFLGISRLKQPDQNLDPAKKSLLAWVESHTEPADEIASPGFLPVEIPLVTGRGTYSGNGFPFEDRCMEENYRRYVNLFGEPTGPMGRMGADRHFAEMDLQSFAAISPKPDWVILEKASLGASRSLKQAKPAFENESYVVYGLK